MEVVVESHGRRIGRHGIGGLNHLFDKRSIKVLHPQVLGSTDHFHHLFANQLTGCLVLQQQVCLRVQRYSHTVERHIPYGLFPSCLMIFHKPRLYVGLTELIDDGLHQRFVSA